MGNMMSFISEAASLLMPYTNHFLCATTVHILDKATLTTCNDEATLNDGLDNLYANIPMPNVPVLPTMYNCSNVTITYNISFKSNQ